MNLITLPFFLIAITVCIIGVICLVGATIIKVCKVIEEKFEIEELDGMDKFKKYLEICAECKYRNGVACDLGNRSTNYCCVAGYCPIIHKKST